MNVYAYTADRENYHEITHATGLQMQWFYNAIGKFMLTVPADDYNIAALENDGILYISDFDDLTFTIQNIKYDTAENRITANGYTSNWLLNKRAITSRVQITNVETAVYTAVSNNLRGLPGITLHASAGLEAETDAILYGGQLLDGIMDVLDEAEYGHRLLWDTETRSHMFEVYQGQDLTTGIHAVVFSEEQGTAAQLVITDDNSTFKNYFYLPCRLRNGNDILVEYGSASAGDRYEHWIRSNQTQTADETEAQFRQRMQWECQAEASQRLRRQTFAVRVAPEDFGKAFNLGDKISCVSNRFGVEFEARINGVKYALDSRGPQTTIILGEPQLTALNEVKLSGRY